MAVPSSGQLRLNGDINLEINGTATGTDVSLNALSIAAGFSAPNGMQEFYGYVDAVAPSVSTLTSTSVTNTSMTIRGNVTSDGGGTITERGFYFGTDLYTATNNTKYTVSGTTGTFSRSMTGLSPGVTYGIWAYATNSVGTTLGSRVMTATPQPNASALFVSFGNSYGSAPPTQNNYSCRYSPISLYTSRNRSNAQKTNSTAITFWAWTPSQSSTTVPQKSYSFSGYGTMSTNGQVTFGGSSSTHNFYESIYASGHSPHHLIYANVACV